MQCIPISNLKRLAYRLQVSFYKARDISVLACGADPEYRIGSFENVLEIVKPGLVFTTLRSTWKMLKGEE